MKDHISFPLEELYNNHRIAQNVGISAAKESFKKSIKYRNCFFSWDDEPILLSEFVDELHLHYGKIPNNMDELRIIVKESCLIEYSNLKETYKKPLPVSSFSDEEVFSSFVSSVTHDILKERKKSNFSNFLKNFGEFQSMNLNQIVEKSYPVEILRKKSMDTLDILFEKKQVSIEMREKITQYVEDFWTNFKIF